MPERLKRLWRMAVPSDRHILAPVPLLRVDRLEARPAHRARATARAGNRNVDNPATGMTPDSRSVCEICYWRGLRADLLRARNPFNPEKAIFGCPQCKRVNTMRPTCIEEGCFERALFGEFAPKVGWRTHCVRHRPAAKGKAVKRIEPLVLKSRSSVKP